jgi:recombinational DNA repair protein RecT
MTKEQVDAVRAASPGANGDAWVNHYIEMGKKTAIRRLSKTTPMSQDKNFAKALDIDARAESGEAQDYSDVIEVIGDVAAEAAAESGPAPLPEPSRTDAARERLQQRAGQS